MPAASGRHHIAGASAPVEILWDRTGIAHVFAACVDDAYRGMGYACASERLWQIHLSCLYANGNAAAEMGPKFVALDALHRSFDVGPARVGVPASEGDGIAQAYLDGLNAWIDRLADVPAEFERAGTVPRHFTLADLAARYRFTGWFQHRSWPEKMMLGRLIARHGIERFRNHVNTLTAADEAMCAQLEEPNAHLDVSAARLLYPELAPSGSNNWAVTSARSVSGAPMLATDPHQAHSIPNTFFHAHLSAPGWDVFGAAFPGVPYFMMGFTRRLAWGLTTGMVDTYDVYVEELDSDRGRVRSADGWRPLQRRTETIEVAGEAPRELAVETSAHGPLLETLTDWLGWSTPRTDRWRTAVHWSMTGLASSGGVLARLPLAQDADAFGDLLFEDDVCPLVNNIICVDRDDRLRRFIAATLPVREGFSGSVPLAGWHDIRFRRSRADELLVESDPASGVALTANNDTLGRAAPFPIHTFAVHPARANRIAGMLAERERFSVADFQRMQLDLVDLRARELVPQLLDLLRTGRAGAALDPRVELAVSLLDAWDCRAGTDSVGACVYYPLLARHWHVRFMQAVLGDEVLASLPVATPALSRWHPAHFLADGSPWRAERDLLERILADMVAELVDELHAELGEPHTWAWGRLQQLQVWHALARRDARFEHMQLGPDAVPGSPTTLNMAVFKGAGPSRPEQPGGPPCRVYHGPAFRMVVDLADPEHCQFVIAGGNGGRPDSPFIADHYPTWLRGGYFTVTLRRDEIDVHERWQVSPE